MNTDLNLNDLLIFYNIMFTSWKKNNIPENLKIESFENLFNKLNLIINRYIINPEKKKLNIKGEGCYIHMLNKYKSNFILNSDDIILEIGSRDALDSIDLYNKFKCNIYSFECNPTAIEIMKQNINFHLPQNENIKIVSYAINDIDDDNINFYPTIIDNIGASSLYKLNTNSNNKEIINHTNRHIQKKIKVKSIRLDTWIKKYNIDYKKIKLLCIDLQGNELNALKSMSHFIKTVEIIICEGQRDKCYHDSCLIIEIYNYLIQYNFICLNLNNNKDKAFSDFIFIKNL
tara:strand:- start:67 stop:930 length:864 start_codon:yes stop_codon:yes gene_type:complete